jgi:hypothetical protein
VQTSPAYHWRIIDADNLALYLDGRQVGHYAVPSGVYRPLIDAASKTFADTADLPTPLPAGTRDPAAVNYGVESDKIAAAARYSRGGREVTRESALRAVGKSVPDDRANLALTVIHRTQADADAVKAALLTSSAMAEFLPTLHVQAYAADNPLLNCGFVATGAPTIYLADAGGKVLHRQDHFDGGPASVAGAVRKARADYDPRRDVDLTRASFPTLSLPPWVRDHAAMLLLAAFVVFTLLRRPPQPDQSKV